MQDFPASLGGGSVHNFVHESLGGGGSVHSFAISRGAFAPKNRDQLTTLALNLERLKYQITKQTTNQPESIGCDIIVN